MVVVLPLEEFCSLFCKVSQKLQKAKGFNHVWYTRIKLPIIHHMISAYLSYSMLYLFFYTTVSETNFILGIRSNFSYKRGWRIGFCLLFFPKLFFTFVGQLDRRRATMQTCPYSFALYIRNTMHVDYCIEVKMGVAVIRTFQE